MPRPLVLNYLRWPVVFQLHQTSAIDGVLRSYSSERKAAERRYHWQGRRHALGLLACGEFAKWSAIAAAAWPGAEPGPGTAATAGCGAVGRSAMPAEIMRARNSSGSMVRLFALMVSTKDAAEYYAHSVWFVADHL